MVTHSNEYQFCRVNLSGKEFKLPKDSLLRHPETRLGKLASLPTESAHEHCDHYDDDTHEFYFARSSFSFSLITDWYTTGTLHRPDCCPSYFLEELKFWEINPDEVAPCCQFPKRALHDDSNGEATVETVFQFEKNISRRSLTQLRRYLWLILEYPGKSRVGKVFAGWSFSVLAISTLLVILSSYRYYQPVNFPSLQSNATEVNEQVLGAYERRMQRALTLLTLSNCCATWFAIEFLLRLFAAPMRCAYLCKLLTILDLLSFLPYFIFLAIAYSHILHDMETIRRIMFSLRMLRLMQLMRFMHYSESCKLVFETFARAKKDLGFLFCIVFALVLVLSTVMYFIESAYPKSEIQNIPTAMYWCFITVSTVGFGDVVPISPLGRAFACVVTLLGVLTLSLPVSLIVSKFTKAYSQQNNKQEFRRRHREHYESNCAALPNTTIVLLDDL